MATLDFTISEVATRGDHCHILTWANMANGDDGTPLQMPGSADRTVQVFGTFGAGGNVRIEGSNDGTHWNTLRSANYTDLNITSAGIHQVVEVTRYIRPIVTGGDGTTSLTVCMLARRQTR